MSKEWYEIPGNFPCLCHVQYEDEITIDVITDYVSIARFPLKGIADSYTTYVKLQPMTKKEVLTYCLDAK